MDETTLAAYFGAWPCRGRMPLRWSAARAAPGRPGRCPSRPEHPPVRADPLAEDDLIDKIVNRRRGGFRYSACGTGHLTRRYAHHADRRVAVPADSFIASSVPATIMLN